LSGQVVGVGGDYVEGVESDDFCVVCEVHCFGKGYGDTQASKTAWACGDVNVVDLFGLCVEVAEQGEGGGEKLCAVSHQACEVCLSEQVRAECEGDGTCSAGSFNG